MRLTDRQSMGSSAAMPQPMSQNAPKLHQMWGHGAGNDAAGLQRIKILCPAAALCLGAGEQVVFLAVLVKLGAHDDKAGRAAHPGQHGNVLDGLAGCGVHTVRKRHDAAQPAQLKPQAVPCVVGQGCALQHLAAGHAAAQLLAAQVVRIAAKAFGSIFQHFRFLISYKICGGVCDYLLNFLCGRFAKQHSLYYNKNDIF